jgi:hypothetical protein
MKPLVVSISQRRRAETLQPGLEIDHFNTDLKAVCSNASPAERFVFWGMMIGVF